MRPHLLKSFSAAALIPLVLALAGPAAPSTSAPSKMTNGCNVSARGIPSCGAFMGGAYGANANVAPWENYNDKRLGVHRTYWGSSNIASAVRTAKADASKKRVPWMSFKAPYSWSAMANGKGDAWARNLATKMKSVGSPVWVAVHHEPEGDGDMQVWKRMQARLAPIMRAAAPNLGYSIILMGYHQFHGAAKYSLSRTWPNTKIDVVGFDIYEKYGAKGVYEWKKFTRSYFEPIQAWAKRTGVAWGLAETGLHRQGGPQGLRLDVAGLPVDEGTRGHRVLLLQHQPAQRRELEAGHRHQEGRLQAGQPDRRQDAVAHRFRETPNRPGTPSAWAVRSFYTPSGPSYAGSWLPTLRTDVR